MPIPLLFMGLPLICAPVFYSLQRYRRESAWGAAGMALLLTVLVRALPLNGSIEWLGGALLRDTFTILGRDFTIKAADQLTLAYVFGQAALLFVLSLFTPVGHFFIPVGFAILGFTAAALFVQPFVFAALFIALAASLAVFILVDTEGQPSSRGAWRFLVFTMLGLPFILLAGWQLEQPANLPLTGAALMPVLVLLGLGLAIWQAIAPFHSWLPVVTEHAAPLAAVFVLTAMRFSTVFLLLAFLNTYPALGQHPITERVLTLAGGGVALVGALFAFGQRNLGRVMGYAVLIDFGAVLLAIGLRTTAGLEAALATLALRGMALPVWAVGLTHLRRITGGRDDFESLIGFAWKYPAATATTLIGLLSLVGFPLTAGFPVRWALLTLLAHIHPSAALILLLGMTSIALVCARGLMALLARPADAPRPEHLWDDVIEPPRALLGLGLVCLLLLMLSLFPQSLTNLLVTSIPLFSQYLR
jgi:formate hydrogenlyase subunit 3/multisubunit Na+/H+ antiporter MnhD subunit